VSVRRWHWGKIAILWAWGGTTVALLLTTFLSSPADRTPVSSIVSFVGSIALLVALTCVTWRWLGGKEERE
jgi:protein-S-isoprenylcysteine O-methyltransferase Ste14